jgi:hypothetical protein
MNAALSRMHTIGTAVIYGTQTIRPIIGIPEGCKRIKGVVSGQNHQRNLFGVARVAGSADWLYFFMKEFSQKTRKMKYL